MIIIAYWILKGKTSEKGFVCFLILYCIYCSINITVFFSNILLALHIMTRFLALKTSISLLIWSKFIEKIFILVLLKKANCSMLSHTDTHTFAYSRIHYSSLRDKMIGCHFWKFFFKYLYFVVWNTTWLVRNKKIHFKIKNFTFKSSLIICR